ncbi:RsmE family RNA methyltransferase [Liberiplasma polymorphum]|uniref:RsmE family RNA methyltransferase n=1 Tax=Liberiplasma polymorphum TaxID=3374570 RepID=UPI0037743A66
MQRYFINEVITDQLIIKDSNQVHHMRHVMRMKKGDRIVVCDHEGTCYYMSIEQIATDEVALNKVQALPKIKKSFHVTLAQSLIRKDHFELVFQKATELGADTIIPIETERTIIKYKDKAIDQKQKRWETIIQEASEQSHRNKLCHLETIMPLKTLDFKPYDHVFVAYEQEKNISFKSMLATVKSDAHIMIIIGPEGGFSEGEIKFLKDKGVVSISLGPRILRSETAAMFALSAISLMLEMSD